MNKNTIIPPRMRTAITAQTAPTITPVPLLLPPGSDEIAVST